MPAPYKRSLGQSNIQLSPIGLGTWQFANGKGPIGNHWNNITGEQAQAIVKAALDSGVNWFDTAEAYGDSEVMLRKALANLNVKPESVHIATKWWPKKRKAKHMLESINERIKALQDYPISLYQIHWPESESWLRMEMKVLAQLIDEGHVQSVGLCNYSSKLLHKAHKYLKKRDIPLASIQARYNLLHRDIEHNDVLNVAKDLGVTVIAWSPLEQGLLSGRFHEHEAETEKMSASRQQMIQLDAQRIKATQPLITLLNKIGQRHNCSAGQVALAWLISAHDDAVIAIPGASTISQAYANGAAMIVQLISDEIEELSITSLHLKQNH